MSDTPTIRALATKLGMGKSTVQRALAGLPGISKKTAARVKAAADELGYRPDPLFSSLAMLRARSKRDVLEIAYLQSRDLHMGVNSYDVIKTYATTLGYSVQLIDPKDFGAGKRLLHVIYNRGYAGVIIGSIDPSWHAAILVDTQLPIICCGRIDPLPLHTVQPDIVNHVRVVWKQMRTAGYTRIGPAICQHNPAVEDDIDRLGSILACQQEIPEQDRIPPLLAHVRDHDALLKWFHEHKPQSILGFSPKQYHVLKQAGVSVSQIGFAALHAYTDPDNVEIAGTVELNDSVAQAAVHLLDQFIRHRAIGLTQEPLHVLVPGRWKPGASLPVIARA